MIDMANENEITALGLSLRALIDASPKFKNRSDFARRCGMDLSHLRRYELGISSPQLKRLREWAELLECSIGELVGESVVPRTQSGARRIPPAFRDFQRHDGVDITPDERDWLLAQDWPQGTRPTVMSYHQLLGVMRLTLEQEGAGKGDAQAV